MTRPAKKLAPECLQHAEAAPVNPNANPATETQEEEPMLLKNETLTPLALLPHAQQGRVTRINEVYDSHIGFPHMLPM